MRLLPAYLLLTGIPSILAIPAGSSITPQPPLLPAHQLSHPPDPRRPWTRLRDWVIESVWGIEHSNCPKHTQNLPPSNVRDRYESDVVLRFQIRQPEEADALAAASRVLLLDVWAITADYVDIRLTDSMVSTILFDSFNPSNSSSEWLIADIRVIDPFPTRAAACFPPYIAHPTHG